MVCLKTLCERVSELERLKKVREKLVLVDTAINTETQKDHIEDEHDSNHCVEGNQSPHWREMTILVNNHEDEENENSGHDIHEDTQQQN